MYGDFRFSAPHGPWIACFLMISTDNRSDILAFEPKSGADFELDVSLAHPWCLDSLKATSIKGVAAMKWEEKKEAQYNSKLLPEGPAYLSFLSFSNVLAIGANKL